MNRDEILAKCGHLKTETLDIPDFGKVTIRELTAAKARELNSTTQDVNLMPVLWVIASVINEDGSPAFTPADIPLFDNMSQAAVRRISNAAIVLNGLNEPDDDIAKNSKASQD